MATGMGTQPGRVIADGNSVIEDGAFGAVKDEQGKTLIGAKIVDATVEAHAIARVSEITSCCA